MPPTPAETAETANSALRVLATATREVDDPEQLYVVLGDILGGIRALEATLGQLADAHTTHQGRAISLSGDRAEGHTTSSEAQATLRKAGRTLTDVEESLETALRATGAVTWNPASPAVPHLAAAVEIDPADASQRMSAGGVWRVVTLQAGSTADKAARLTEEHGAEAAIAYLAQADRGDPATMRELEAGYAHDEPPETGHERVFHTGTYQLILNHEGHWAGLSQWNDVGSGQPSPPPLPEALRTTAPSGGGAGQQWVTVAAHHGAGADRVMGILNELGEADAFDYLAQFDRGADSTREAMAAGNVFDAPPDRPGDTVLHQGDHALVINPHRHEALLLRHHHPDTTTPETGGPGRKTGPELLVAYASRGAPPLRHQRLPRGLGRNHSAASWFDHPGTSPTDPPPGLGR